MVFAALDRQDLVTMVARTLTRAIVEGRLSPGSHLNEVRLAQEFDISRAPLREALRRLESQGLVEAHPRRGFFLRSITASAMSELFELRLSLERTAGVKVAQTVTPAQIARLETQFETLRAAARKGEPSEQTEEDFRFHRLVCELSGNARLLQFFDQISSEIRFGIVHLRGIHHDSMALANSHAPLVEALKHHAPDAYAAALELHLGEARDKLVEALEAKGEGAVAST